MASKLNLITPLAELANGQEADFFALLTAKEELKTRDGKPYFKVTFRDAAREVGFPIWNDSPLALDCKDAWRVGEFYKLRATYRESQYGPQLEIKKIRQVVDADSDDGFDPNMCSPQSRFDSGGMFSELTALIEERITDKALQSLVLYILNENRTTLLTLPAATRNHHAYVGGYLEHVLSVTKTCAYLADKYDDYYPDLQPRLDKSLVIAGAILHDIGKLREIEQTAAGAEYTAAGTLIGHMLQGRDILLEASKQHPLPADTLLRLEHVIISHQRLPEWGSPKPPMTPEALIVHYADDLDAKYNMMFAALRDSTDAGPMTSKKNRLFQQVYRGEK
ncbi:MAG: HD domain-containing protein [Planctomycetota bacterium]|nr:HD domain-containing protein [Planctomycetota bacterium]